MHDKVKFWETVKKKPVHILGITAALTFVIVKLIDFVLNWYLNKDVAPHGPSYNYTISIFSPVFFVIFFIFTTNLFKKNMNKNTSEDKGMKSKYGKTYTWKDIFKDKESIAFFVIITLGIFALLYTGTQWISSLSGNYAIDSLRYISLEILIIISAVISVFVVVVLQNTIIAWLINTEKGNKALGKIVFLFGVLTFLVMCGINYLWANPNEILSSFRDDYAIGLIIPFDVQTMVFGLITLWLRKKAKVYATGQRKMIKWGTVLAVVSIIISFTPLQILIQGAVISLIHGMDVLNV